MTTPEHTHDWPVWGHDWAVDFLQRSIAHRRNRHAYLITGPRQIGKMQLALNLRHDPQLHPRGRKRPPLYAVSFVANSSIVAITPTCSSRKPTRNRARYGLMPFGKSCVCWRSSPSISRYRVAIFEDFDNAQFRAQDALLKTLEEPPPHAVLILLAESTENLMATITSRCQLIPLRPVSQALVERYLQMHGADDERAALLARLSSGRIGWALNALRDETVMAERDDMLNMLQGVINGNRVQRFEIAEQLDKIGRNDKQALRYLLEMWQTYWRDVLLLAEGSPVKPCNSDRYVEMQQLVQHIQPDAALKALQVTRSMLTETLKTNANLRMAFEVLFLDYPGLG